MAIYMTESDVDKMALYNLDRAYKTMELLADKATWEPEDTASFDCMHYLGDAALDNAASQLGLKAGDRVVDIGSGFNATGRYLHQKYGVDVTGIELQTAIHKIANNITEKNKMSNSVRSINDNFAKVDLQPESFDHIVSLLCIGAHIADRAPILAKAFETLKPGGKMYIEDLYAKTARKGDDKDWAMLRDVMFSPDLPSRERYTDELKTAGFSKFNFQDMLQEWAAFVHERAVTYKAKPDHEPSLLAFYDTVDYLFSSGRVGGARITCAKKSG